jgi:hypothetical protein
MGTEVEKRAPAETTGTPPPQEGTEGAGVAPQLSEEKVEKKELQKSDTPGGEPPIVDLKNFEVTEDGRVKIVVGNSTYFGKDVDEAWQNALKGIEEKDKAYQKVQEENRRLKAQSSIREPEEITEEELPPEPKREEYIRSVFAERGLDVNMAAWDPKDPKWDRYQEEHNLKDRHVVQLIADVQAAVQEAARRFYADETKWLNVSLLRTEITPSVREMVLDANLDPDEFGETYMEVLKMPESRYKTGEFNRSAILKAINKKIVEKLKATKVESTELERHKERLKQELEEKKKQIASASSRSGQHKKDQNSPKNLEEAFRMAATLFGGG